MAKTRMKALPQTLMWLAVAAACLVWMGADYAFGQATLVATYAIAGLGVALITGQAGQIVLGQGAMMALGAYTQALLVMHGCPPLLALPFAALAGALGGVLASLPAARLDGLFFGMSTLAFALIVEETLTRLEPLTNGSAGLAVPPLSMFIELQTPLAQFLFSAATLALTLLTCRRLIRSPLGRRWRAVREDEISAAACGIDPMRTKIGVFVVGGGLTAFGGALYAHWIGFISPEQFSLKLSFELLVLAFIGGRSLAGVVLGALVIVTIPQFIAMLRDLVPSLPASSAGLEMVLFGAIIVAVALWRLRDPKHRV